MKKVVTALVVAFSLFYLITEPVSAAEAVRDAVGAVAGAFRSVVTFFSALIG